MAPPSSSCVLAILALCCFSFLSLKSKRTLLTGSATFLALPVFLFRMGSSFKGSSHFNFASASSICPVMTISSGRHVLATQTQRFCPSFANFWWQNRYAINSQISPKDALSNDEAMHLLSQHLVPKETHKAAAPGQWRKNSPHPWQRACCENLSSLDISTPSFFVSIDMNGTFIPITWNAWDAMPWSKVIALSLFWAFSDLFFITHRSITKNPLQPTVWSDHWSLPGLACPASWAPLYFSSSFRTCKFWSSASTFSLLFLNCLPGSVPMPQKACILENNHSACPSWLM